MKQTSEKTIRKPIQMLMTPPPRNYEQGIPMIWILCDDGTIWCKNTTSDSGWSREPDVEGLYPVDGRAEGVR